MAEASLAEKIAAAILDVRLCLQCIALKTAATAAAVMSALPGVRNLLELRIDPLAACEACGSRTALTYLLARSRGSSDSN